MLQYVCYVNGQNDAKLISTGLKADHTIKNVYVDITDILGARKGCHGYCRAAFFSCNPGYRY